MIPKIVHLLFTNVTANQENNEISLKNERFKNVIGHMTERQIG